MARTWMFLLLLPGWPGAAAADELHKCLAADGAVSYQSAPCAGGARTLWTRTVAAEPAPARPTARVSVDDGKAAPVRRPVKASAPAAPRRDAAAARCASARRSADATRDRLWNRLSFRQRSELDAKVAQACSG